MNVFAWVLLAALGAAAGASWWAASRQQRDVEVLGRTVFRVLLLALAWLLRADTVDYGRALLLALLLGLVGDWVRLGRFGDSPVGERVALGTVLVRRVAYVITFALMPASAAPLWLAVMVVAILLVWGGRLAVVPEARARWRVSLPLLGYAVVVLAVPVAAWSSGSAAIGWGGAVLFAGDALMGYQRSGRVLAQGPLAAEVLHDVAEVLIVMAVLRG
ncbi:MAG: lysoplasmalogenase family protein [Dermatophilaceae bacterium]